MSDNLRSDLQNINGVGDATADAILDVLAEHERPDTDDSDLLERALAYAQNHNDKRAGMMLRRYADD